MKINVNVLVSTCPNVSEEKWNPKEPGARSACKDTILVKIVPESGRASRVFRLHNKMASYNEYEGNPYSIYGNVVQAHTGTAKRDTSISVFSASSGSLWLQWNGKFSSEDVLKRSKFKEPEEKEAEPEPSTDSGEHCNQLAFDVILHGAVIDTVFYSADSGVEADEVRESLINHDGYSPAIEVVQL